MRLKFIISIIICSMIFCACGNTKSEPSADPQKGTYSLGVAALLEGTSETTSSDESSKDTSELIKDEADTYSEKPSESESNTSLYESFLHNRAKVHINPKLEQGSYFGFEVDTEQDYTLEEMVNAIIDSYIKSGEDVKIWLDTINYAYIDCGNDGDKELALMIYTPMYSEGWEQYLIIKEIDGSLQTVYSDVAWSRNAIYLNEYGYIFGDGSEGAAYHGYDKSYIDADGNLHFIYSDTSTSGISLENDGGVLWFNGTSHIVPGDTELDGDYAFLDFDFNNTIDDDSDNIYTYAKLAEGSGFDWASGIRGYFYSDLVNDDALYEDSHPLKQFFNNEGLHIYTLNEIDQMIADKEEQEGLTEDIKNGENVVWGTLDYDFVPYIATYNDDNFLHKKEYFPLHFMLCAENGFDTILNIQADGSIKGSYSNYISYDNNAVVNRNEFTGLFTIESTLSDTMYILVLSDYSLAYEVGTSETKEYRKDFKTTSNYVDVPGFDDGGTRYCLFSPGTKKSDIEANALSTIPDYFLGNMFDNDVLNSYILYGLDGNNYTWRISW